MDNIEKYELTDEELLFVTGGAANDYLSGSFIALCMKILADMDLHPSEDMVRDMIAKGGSVLRNWALQHSGGDKRANFIPVF